MSIAPDSARQPSPEAQAASGAAMAPTRPLYWSVRRELWEHRSITVAPLAVAGVVLLGFVIGLSHRLRGVSALDPAQQHAAINTPYDVAAFLFIATSFIVSALYCLDALHGERRDRSILFWKSLPVSDLTTVLSKASIPLVVLPLLVFLLMLATHLVMLPLSSLILRAKGVSPAALWAQLPLFRMWLALLYCLTVIALWHAPVFAWLLLLSAWARRAAFLWAVLPPLGVAVFDRIAFNSWHVAALLKYRLVGWFTQAFVPPPKDGVPVDPLMLLDPLKFLGTADLWIGLALAALFLAAAVRLRRHRQPI